MQSRRSHKHPGGPEAETCPAAEACAALGAVPEAEPSPRTETAHGWARAFSVPSLHITSRRPLLVTWRQPHRRHPAG